MAGSGCSKGEIYSGLKWVCYIQINSAGHRPVTYFGDGEWDQIACRELGCNFILVGDRFDYHKKIADFQEVERVLEMIDEQG